MNRLDPHQHRVSIEHAELSMKIDALQSFLLSDAFFALPADEKARLRRQIEAMREYCAILEERIKAW